MTAEHRPSHAKNPRKPFMLQTKGQASLGLIAPVPSAWQMADLATNLWSVWKCKVAPITKVR
jgi:hypothetical protein